MSQYWEEIAKSTRGEYTAQDFETAAYRLITEQSLYANDKYSRAAYAMIHRYTPEFQKVLDPLGIEISVNNNLRYVHARPLNAKFGVATVNQTILALVFRSIYDIGMKEGRANNDGEIMVEMIELEEQYKLETQRDMPSKSEFDANMRQLRRWGIIRHPDQQIEEEIKDDEGTKIYFIIRPVIVDILGQNVLQRLGQWAQNKTTELEETPDNNEIDDTEVANEIS